MKLTEIERAEITTALATLCEARARLMEVEDSLPELEGMGFGEEEETIQQMVLDLDGMIQMFSALLELPERG